MHEVRAVSGEQPFEWVVQEFSFQEKEFVGEVEMGGGNEIIHRSMHIFCSATDSSAESAIALFEEMKLPPVINEAEAAEHQKRVEYRAKKEDIDRQLYSIVIEVDGLVFDGHINARNALTSAVIGMDEGESMQWKLANNSLVSVTRSQLKRALRLVGIEQTRIITE